MSIINVKEWWEDKNAKSISFFSKKELVLVNKDMIEELKSISLGRGNQNARFCLHDSPESTLHDMIILEYQDKKCRKPHKHLEKDETLQMIEGAMMALMFDDEGGLIKKALLDKDNFAYRNPKGVYHIWLPIGPYVVYREIKQGPFQQEDNVSAKFNHEKTLRKYVDFMDLACHNPACKNPCSLSYKIK